MRVIKNTDLRMKDNIWNIVLGTLATAILGLLGYVLINLNAIQQEQAGRRTVEFTTVDANELQKELTKIITDVDMRIRLIERDIQWIKMGAGPMPVVDPPFKIDALPDPSPDPPRYQLEER